jgi:hypothetical protein
MISSLKAYLKIQATTIHSTKQELKKFQRENRGYDGNFYHTIKTLVYDYRHKHIAYCLLKGTPYELIEKPHEGNEPDLQLIQEIQNEYTKDVCIGAQGSC